MIHRRRDIAAPAGSPAASCFVDGVTDNHAPKYTLDVPTVGSREWCGLLDTHCFREHLWPLKPGMALSDRTFHTMDLRPQAHGLRFEHFLTLLY